MKNFKISVNFDDFDRKIEVNKVNERKWCNAANISGNAFFSLCKKEHKKVIRGKKT